MKRAGLFVAISLLLPGLLFGQRTASTVSGTVTDASGALVPRAHVSTKNTATGAATSADTDGQGFYAFTDLEAGPYELRVNMSGFQEYVRNGITLQVGQSVTVNVALQVGSTSAQVTVTAEAPLVDTRTQSTSFAITPQFTEEIPLNGRNIMQLMAVAPDTSTYSGSGWAQQSATRVESSAGYVNASSGATQSSTEFYLDGGLNMDAYTQVANVFPNPDAVEEFTFDTNSANAKYAGMGGGVVNAVTRGGTNRFHGSAFEYVRNGKLNGRNFFAASQDTLKQNQFGGSVGGPIQKDKTFAFFSFQRTTVRAGTSAHSVFGPTFAELGKNPDGSPHYCPGSTTQVCGDWSAISGQLYNTVLTRDANGLPVTFTTDRSQETPFLNNQVPVSLYVPIASKALGLVPQGDPITGKVNYVSGTITNDMQFVARGDRNFGDKWRISGVYLQDPYHTPAVLDPKNILTDTYNKDWDSIRGTLNAVYTVRPNLVTTIGATYNLILMRRHGNPGYKSFLDLGANFPNFNPGLQEVGDGTGWWTATLNDHLVTNRDQIHISDNTTYIRGKHTLDFGAEYINTHSKEGFDYFGSGYSYQGCGYTGYSPLDFMLGQNCGFQEYGMPYVFLRNAVPVAYANDGWRLNRRLTLNLGLRWEPWQAFTDHSASKMGDLFDPGAFAAGTHSTRFPNLPPGLLTPGDPGVPGSLAPNDWKVFDPRMGLAWDVKGDGKTSVRAGVGIYHNQIIGLSFDNMETSPPFFTSYAVTDPTVPWFSPYNAAPYNGVLPKATPTPPPSSTTFPLPLTQLLAFFPRYKPPATAQWNLTVEHQLGWGVVARASYEASESWHMFDTRDINAATYIPGTNPDGSAKSTASNATQRRPYYPYYGGQIDVNETLNTSSFNALATSVEKRMTGNLSLLAGYRWSKCLDIAGTPEDFAQDDFIDSRHTRFDRGRCSADVASQFKFASVYHLPSLQSWGFAGRNILGGWELSGILNWRDGYPYSVTSNFNANLDGDNSARADLVGNPNLPGGRSETLRVQQWFNTAAFHNAAVGTSGTSPRDFLRGPRYSDLDSALIKSFPIRYGPLKEGQNIQFRAEFFNTFNHTNFSNPVSQVNNSQFGQIVAAGSPRIIQFALRFNF